MPDASSSPEILLLSRDLFFASQIEGVCRRLGCSLVSVANPADLAARALSDAAAGVIIDLTLPGLDVAHVVAALREVNLPRIVAFGPHVAERQLSEAREAGCDDVMPRSRFSMQMNEIVAGLLGPRT